MAAKKGRDEVGSVLYKIPKCELDSRGCLSLKSINETLCATIKEEHAWAICYQVAKCGQIILNDPTKRDVCLVADETHHLLLHKDGTVHVDTFLEDSHKEPRKKSSCECKLIAELAVIIFNALNYGLEESYEHVLKKDLESLLDSMNVAADNIERGETDDEGIERDSGDSDDDRTGTRAFTFDSMLEVCTRRFCAGKSKEGVGGLESQAADNHYKAVCRALVAEAIELSSFLEKVSQGTQKFCINSNSGLYRQGFSHGQFASMDHHDPELDKLHFTDWARLWVQVIRDLRAEIKLKKVSESEYHQNSRRTPIEYELTPYEILMDDIRSRRYKLNQVMVDGTLPPRVKKDAHAIILDFIRSRPPLRKAADRILGPAPEKVCNPIELLMESIRQEHTLKPTPRRRDSLRTLGRRQNSTSEMTPSPECNRRTSSLFEDSSLALTPKSSVPSTPSTVPQRRLIKADVSLTLFNDSKSEEDDDEEDEISQEDAFFSPQDFPSETQSSPATPWHTDGHSRLEPEFESSNGTRRNSFGMDSSEFESISITFPFEYTTPKEVPPTVPLARVRKSKLPKSLSKSSLRDEFLASEQWQLAINEISLTLEEFVHIRHVLTKAELEALPVDIALKQDVEKGNVCFLCLRTKFQILGPWRRTCKLCKQVVCAKCCSKMRIPTDHFAMVPVSTLSPTLSPKDEEKEFTSSQSPCSQRKSATGSAPTSPKLPRKEEPYSLIEQAEVDDQFPQDFHSSNTNGPQSLPASISQGIMAFKRRSFGRRDENAKGAVMEVCHDCKGMVLEVIKASKTKKVDATHPAAIGNFQKSNGGSSWARKLEMRL